MGGAIVRHRQTQAVHHLDEFGVDPVHVARTEIAQDIVDFREPGGDVVSVLPIQWSTICPCGYYRSSRL